MPRDRACQFQTQRRRPETPEEETLCKEAMEGCPVEAIGSDGA
jgi:ferredoxin